MPTDKQRVTLYLNKSKYERMKAVAARIPGASVSALVEDLMMEPVQYLEDLLDLADEGNRDARAEVFALSNEAGWDRIADAILADHLALKRKESKH